MTAARAGVGLKPRHCQEVLADEPDIGWFEVHPENYMGAGGPPHAYLERIRARYPVSLHGVGLSIGGAAPLDTDHLDRLKALVTRYRPMLVSEHLAWSTHRGRFYNDLLALPYTGETLRLVSDHIDQTQDHLGRQILLENPATYLAFAASSYDEIDFIAEVARRTGCGLLLDVNNVHISCVNHGGDAAAYIERFPIAAVGEIHLAGHAPDMDSAGREILIDTHDRPVADPVWALYARALARSGPLPTLIEWDNDVPDWPTLMAEAKRADTYLHPAEGRRHVA